LLYISIAAFFLILLDVIEYILEEIQQKKNRIIINPNMIQLF